MSASATQCGHNKPFGVQIMFPLNTTPFTRGIRIWTPSNTWFLGPTRVHTANGISIGLALIAGMKIITD